jgi:hypothetical protein
MLQHTFKFIPIFLSIFVHSTVLGAEGNKFDVENDVPLIQQVTISRPQSGEISTWSEKIDTFFPDTRQEYHIVMDLSSLETLALCNLNKFFLQLSTKKPVISQISQITLTNGTSFRFNKIKEGLITMLKQNSQMAVEYLHKGIQTPASPAKALKSVANVRGCTLQNPSAGHFILKPDESDGEQIEAVVNGTLSPRIQNYEKDIKIESLETQFSSIDDQGCFATWPPFGINQKDQILELYCGEIPNFKAGEGINPVFLILSGMGRYNIGDLYNLCVAYPSIKALQFVNSALKPKDLESLLPLIGKQLLMLEVSGAFGKYDKGKAWAKLEQFLKTNNNDSLIRHFSLKELTVKLEPHQEAMSLISDYVKIIKDNDEN